MPNASAWGIDLNKYIEKSITRIYNRKLKAGDVDAELIRQTAEKVWKGVQKGWAAKKEIDKLPFGSPGQRLLMQYRYNIHVAMVFKNHHNTRDIVGALFDSNGKVKSFSQFKKDALKISDKYNKQWLKTEYNTAVSVAENAGKWQDWKKKGGYLQFRTQRDGRVRDAHNLLDGATYPVDHPFWNIHTPPLGWSCRCFLVWVGDDATETPPKGLPDVKPPFNQNPGETGLIFTEDMPIFQVDPAFETKAANLFGYKPPVDPARYRANLELFQLLSKDPDFKLEHTDNLSGGVLFSHIRVDRRDLPINLKVGRSLASRGDSVIINEHVQIPKIKNPELTINGVLSDVKTPVGLTTTAINSAFDRAEHQLLDRFVLNLKYSFDVNTIVRGIERGFRNTKKIEILTVYYKGVFVDISRKVYNEGKVGITIREALK